MQPVSRSPARVSFRHLRDPRIGTQSPSAVRSHARTSAAVSPTSAPAPPPPPRQSLVYGPFSTTSITTIVREGSRSPAREGTPEKLIAPIHTAQRDESRTRSDSRGPAPRSSRASSSSQRHATPTSDELRELRQTRSLFLCGRGLLSLRHIQHLPEMLSLRFLSVHMNAIKTLEAGCLSTLRHLVELDLSANELQDLPPECWAGLNRLERLNLSSNLLTRLGPDAFKGLASLQWLSLGFNNVSDLTGLSSVPAAAPLAYVDLCSNRIATVEEVLHALTPHRGHIREIRLASPSASTASPDVTRSDGTALTLTGSYWQVQENFLCRGDGGDHADSTAESAARTSGVVTAGAAAAVPPPPVYVQRLLAFFPHLMVVNGVSYGVDPLEMLTPHPAAEAAEQQQQQQDGGRAREAEEEGILMTRVGGTVTSQTAAGEHGKMLDTSDDFARLLSQPLPHLPHTSSHSPSSSRSTSSASRQHTSRRASRRQGTKSAHSRSRSRSRSQKHSRSASSKKQHENTPSPKIASTTESARRAATDANNSEDNSNRNNPHQSFSATTALSPPEITLVHPTKRRHSAPKPRRAPLRRRSASSTTATTSHTSSVTASPSIVLPPYSTPPSLERQQQQQQQQEEKKQRSGTAAMSSPHVRQLSYDGGDVKAGKELTRQEEGKGKHATPAATPVSTSDAREIAERVQRQTPSDEFRKTNAPGKRRWSGGPGAAAVRSTKQSESGLSPSGITDASDLSPSPERAFAPRRESTSAEGGEEDAFSVHMSCSGSAGSSPERHSAGVAEAGALRPPSSTSHRTSLPLRQRHASAGAGGTSQAANPSSSTKLLPPPPVFSTSPAALQWKPKQISRGTATDAAEMPSREEFAAAIAQMQAEMDTRGVQLQEQLALRATTITDLRHHLDLTRRQYVEAQREAQQHQQQLRSQVAALKDELARRAEEASILQRKQQAQLNRAVDSVKAEWSRRLEAQEQHRAAVQAAEQARWETAASLLTEEKTQLQQTCTMKTSQLATLERQVRVMEEEIERLRHGAVAQRQYAIAQATLLVAEADARRQMEVAAATAFLQIIASSSKRQSKLESEALQEALRQVGEVTEAMDMQLAAFTAQARQYEAALQHATRDAQQLREAQRSDTTESPPDEEQQQHTPGKEVIKVNSAVDSSVVVPPSLTHGSEAEDALPSALVSTPTLTPTHTPQLPPPPSSWTALVVSSVKHEDTSAPTLPPPSDPNDTVSVYWRDVCARAEAKLRRVEAALAVSTTTQQTLANENTRLLHRVESLEADQAKARAAHTTLEHVAAQEKENLLRTLHTLRADLQNKDDALDALEGEAREKLNEKRRRIAELEEEVENRTAQQTRATEMSVSYRTQLEAAQRRLAEVEATLEEEKSRNDAEAQVPAMERKLRELSELLATRVAQAHQHELEKKTLVNTLTTAREQLMRLHEANTLLNGSNAAAKEQLMRQQVELDAARQQLRDTQEATRAKQRATREALSHLMTADAF
ncbi:hypothetical protein ABB37_05347 [Leptomonas pyrrhocoris]|uniref:Leucine-rich repeat protein n=1 Tax=Leptomonas pyrrhocoris TaxID=157538 RepID=A0A0M9FZX4_LEPPY|nr:hypothetical protein ABB37_05347 [Leptomonas pyrrhocoris]KPA79525.1 hypothetical protein ABB37_05347 [Leptomonas pyrrhocoris]|eukprot:XP_015657964.1 hypothetical protein ABB37_05347 [Leptomonas pyrrhocoris]